MTLDEAIADNLRIAEGQEKCAEISVSEHAKERISKCAADHRQLAEWLRELKTRRTQFEKICIELSELFGCPCDFSPMDEIMTEAEGCVEDCGDVDDSECWRRYFKTKGV